MTKGRIWNPSHTSAACNRAIDTCSDYTFKVCLHPSITEALETDIVLTDTCGCSLFFFYPLWSLLSEMFPYSLSFVGCKDRLLLFFSQVSQLKSKTLLKQPDFFPTLHSVIAIIIVLFRYLSYFGHKHHLNFSVTHQSDLPENAQFMFQFSRVESFFLLFYIIPIELAVCCLLIDFGSFTPLKSGRTKGTQSLSFLIGHELL